MLGVLHDLPSPPPRFVDPITVKVPTDRQTQFGSSSKTIDIAGQRGECERVQVWGYDTSAPMKVHRSLHTMLSRESDPSDSSKLPFFHAYVGPVPSLGSSCQLVAVCP